MPPSPTPRRLLPALLLALLCIVGFVTAWATLSLAFERQLAWLSVVIAADMALLLGIARVPPSPMRALLVVLASAATIVLANVFIIAGQLGNMLGLLPWESALRLGPRLTWTLARLANAPGDWALYALALVVGGWIGLSARRPGPSAR